LRVLPTVRIERTRRRIHRIGKKKHNSLIYKRVLSFFFLLLLSAAAEQ
jgi:hypothetical protein